MTYQTKNLRGLKSMTKLDQDQSAIIKAQASKLIEMADWKLESLPEKYFVKYFEEEFLPQIKKLIKQL